MAKLTKDGEMLCDMRWFCRNFDKHRCLLPVADWMKDKSNFDEEVFKTPPVVINAKTALQYLKDDFSTEGCCEHESNWVAWVYYLPARIRNWFAWQRHKRTVKKRIAKIERDDSE
jgi:hypothetical protein